MDLKSDSSKPQFEVLLKEFKDMDFLGFKVFAVDFALMNWEGDAPFYPVNNNPLFEGAACRVRFDLLSEGKPIGSHLRLELQQSLEDCDAARCDLVYSISF